MSDSTNPPLPDEPVPVKASSVQPPLPEESAPTSTSSAITSTRPSTAAAVIIEEEEDEDAPAAAVSSRKGKGKQQLRESSTAPDDVDEAREEDEEEEWDPSAVESKSLKDRKAVEEKPTTTAEKSGEGEGMKDTGGWQAIWAPAQNGMCEPFRFSSPFALYQSVSCRSSTRDRFGV